jgi:hypothetical protein
MFKEDDLTKVVLVMVLVEVVAMESGLASLVSWTVACSFSKAFSFSANSFYNYPIICMSLSSYQLSN